MQYVAILDTTKRDQDRECNYAMISVSKVTGPPRGNGVVETGGNLVIVFFTLNENAPSGCMSPTTQYLKDLANCEYWASKQPTEQTVTLKYPRCGQRVEFTGVIDRFDFFCMDLKGERGTVSYVDDHNIWVKLDEHHPELDEWDNCIQWMVDGDCDDDVRPQHVLFDFGPDVKFID
jgi:hypothetical protein